MNIKFNFLFINLLSFIASCSNIEKSPNNYVLKKATNWYRIYHGSGHSNVYRVSLIPLKNDKENKQYLKKHYNLVKDFSNPNELIQSLEFSGHKAKIEKRNGLSMKWYPKKYRISNLVYYRVKIHKYGDYRPNVSVSYLDQENLNKIKECFVMYSKNVGTLSSQKCLRKYIVN